MAFKGILLAQPAPPPSPAAGFDTDRAFARLARILGDQRPHPVDSAANDAVRARLIAEMRAVGLSPQVRDAFACNGFARRRTIACARVRNVVATIPPRHGGDQVRPAPQGSALSGGQGDLISDRSPQASGGGAESGEARHLLLSAHYDSTFAGPGAADAGIGVATLLEVAANLRGRRLARPVTFLFNEGEEMGLIGARAFVDSDPLAARVDTLLNFEARGVTGPAIMFETSRPSAPAILAFARAAPRPVANSLSTDLYRLIPNSTDVTVFAARPWTILNFAVIGNESRYHSAGDDLAALDRRSLAHMSGQGLAMTLALAERPPAGEGDRLYADFAGRMLVVLPVAIGIVLLALLFTYFLFAAWSRGALGRPLAAILAASAGSAALAFLGHFSVGLLRPGDWWRGYPWVTEIAVYGSALAAGLLAFALILRREPSAERERLRAAFWLVFLAMGGIIALIAPGGLIFFLLPPLIAALGFAFGRGRRRLETIAALLAWLALFLTLGPALDLFEELMSNGPHWIFAPIAAAVLLPALIELQPLAQRIPRALLVAAAGDLVLIPWGAAALVPAYTEDRQQAFGIEYVAGLPADRSAWAVVNDGRPLGLPGEWRRAEVPYATSRRWLSPAPRFPVTPPDLTLLARDAIPGGTRLRLRLAMNGAEAIALVAPQDAPLVGAGVSGSMARYTRVDGRFVFRCIGRACDGAEVALVASGNAPLALDVIGTRTGLPAAGSALALGRPALSRPQYSPDSTITFARLRL